MLAVGITDGLASVGGLLELEFAHDPISLYDRKP
jgi:hypothetical protein